MKAIIVIEDVNVAWKKTKQRMKGLIFKPLRRNNQSISLEIFKNFIADFIFNLKRDENN